MKGSGRVDRFKGRHSGDAYEPTEAEIAEACQRIQAGWSESERKRRLVVAEPQWLPREATTRALDGHSSCTTGDLLDFKEGGL